MVSDRNGNRKKKASKLIEEKPLFTNNKNVIGNDITRFSNQIKLANKFLENPISTPKREIKSMIIQINRIIDEMQAKEEMIKNSNMEDSTFQAEEIKMKKIELYGALEMMAAAYNAEENLDSVGYSQDEIELLKVIEGSVVERPTLGWDSFDEIAGGDAWQKAFFENVQTYLENMLPRMPNHWDSLPWAMFSGPPGTGKTHIINSIAEGINSQIKNWNERNPNKMARGFVYLAPKAGDMQDKYVGNSEKLIKLLFEKASEHVARGKIVLVFIDEFDGIFGKSETGTPRASLIAAFKALTGNQESKTGGICLVGATNHPEFVDSGVLDRFNYKFYVGIPSVVDHGNNLKTWAKKLGYHAFRGSNDIESIKANVKAVAKTWADNRLSNRDASTLKTTVLRKFQKISDDFASPVDEVEYSMWLRHSITYEYSYNDERNSDSKSFIYPIGHLNSNWVKKNFVDRSDQVKSLFSTVPNSRAKFANSFLHNTEFDENKSPWFENADGTKALIGNIAGKMNTKLSIVITKRIKSDKTMKMMKFMTVSYPPISSAISTNTVDTTRPNVRYLNESYPEFQSELSAAQISWDILNKISKKAKPQSINESQEWVRFFTSNGGDLVYEMESYVKESLRKMRTGERKGPLKFTEGEFENFLNKEIQENSKELEYNPTLDSTNGEVSDDRNGNRGQSNADEIITWQIGAWSSINPISRDYLIFWESYAAEKRSITLGEQPQEKNLLI